MRSSDFENRFISFCEHARIRKNNNQIACLVMKFTAAVQWRQQLLHPDKNEVITSELYGPEGAISPYHTGDDLPLRDYLEESFNASRQKFESGRRDNSLHHWVLYLEQNGVEIPDAFINFPALLFGSSKANTLGSIAVICEKLLKKPIMCGLEQSEFTGSRPIMAANPNLDMEEPRRRAQTVPSIICGISEHTEELPLWQIADRCIAEDREPPTWLPPSEWETWLSNRAQSFNPRRNWMTAAEVLGYITFNHEETVGKRIVALGSWQGGTNVRRSVPNAPFEGSGRYIEVDCRDPNSITVLPVNPNTVNGRDSVVVLTYTTIIRNGEPLPQQLAVPQQEEDFKPTVKEEAIVEASAL